MTRVFFAMVRNICVMVLCCAPYFAAQAKVCFLPECASGGGSDSATSNFGNKNCYGYTLTKNSPKVGNAGYDCTSCTNKSGTKYKCTEKVCSDEGIDRIKRLTSAINKPHFVCRVSCQSGEQKYYSCNCEAGYKLVKVTESSDGITTINTANSKCEKICLANEKYDSESDECVCINSQYARKYGDYGPCEKIIENCSTGMTYDDTSNTCFDCRNYRNRSNLNLQQLTLEGKSYRVCFSGSNLYCVNDEFTRYDADNNTCITSDSTGMFAFSNGNKICDDEVNKQLINNDHCECRQSVNGTPMTSVYNNGGHLYCEVQTCFASKADCESGTGKTCMLDRYHGCWVDYIRRTIEQITIMADNTHQLYAGQSNYDYLWRYLAQIMPEDVWDEDDENGYSLWYDYVYVYNTRRNAADTTGKQAFYVEYEFVPQEACIALVTRSWSEAGLGVVRVVNYENTMYPGEDLYIVPPVSSAVAQKICEVPVGRDSDNVDDMTFYFDIDTADSYWKNRIDETAENLNDSCVFKFEGGDTSIENSYSGDDQDAGNYYISSATGFNISTDADWIDADAYLEEYYQNVYEYYFSMSANAGEERNGTVTFTQDGTNGCNKTLTINVKQFQGECTLKFSDGSTTKNQSLSGSDNDGSSTYRIISRDITGARQPLSVFVDGDVISSYELEEDDTYDYSFYFEGLRNHTSHARTGIITLSQGGTCSGQNKTLSFNVSLGAGSCPRNYSTSITVDNCSACQNFRTCVLDGQTYGYCGGNTGYGTSCASDCMKKGSTITVRGTQCFKCTAAESGYTRTNPAKACYNSADSYTDWAGKTCYKQGSYKCKDNQTCDMGVCKDSLLIN